MHCIQIFTSIVLLIVGGGVLAAFALQDDKSAGYVAFGLIGLFCTAFSAVGMFGVLAKNKTLMRVGMFGILSYTFVIQLITILLPVACKGQHSYDACLLDCIMVGFPASLATLIATAILYFCWKKFLFENKEVYFDS